MMGLFLQSDVLRAGSGSISRTRVFRHVFSGSMAWPAISVTASYGEPWLGALARIQSPTVIVAAASDAVTPLLGITRIHQAISKSRLVKLESPVGHDVVGSLPEVVVREAFGLSASTLSD